MGCASSRDLGDLKIYLLPQATMLACLFGCTKLSKNNNFPYNAGVIGSRIIWEILL